MVAFLAYSLLIAFALPIKIQVGGGSVHLGELVLLFVVVYLAACLCSPTKKRASVSLKSLLVISAVFVFWGLVFLSSILNKIDAKAYVEFIRLTLALFFALFSGKYFFSKLPVNAFFYSIITSGVLFSLYIVLDWLYLKDYHVRAGDLFFGGAVGFMPSAAVLALYSQRAGGRVFRWILVGVLIFALLVNGTKAWLFGVVLALTLHLMWRVFAVRKKRDAIVALFLFFALFIAFLFIDDFLLAFPNERLQQVSSLVKFNFEGTTLDSRFYKWALAINQIYESPYFGVGYFNLNLGMPEWVDDQANRVSDSHFIDIFVMSGLIAGALFFVSFFCMYLWLATRNFTDISKRYSSLAVGLLFFSGFFWSLFGGYMVYFFGYFLGMAINVYTSYESDKKYVY
jgi:O-antigen ligase